MKKSLLSLIAALFLASSCSNEDIDVKRDYVFVKVGETSAIYNIRFYTYRVGDSSMDY
jgi:hypothetical protein